MNQAQIINVGSQLQVTQMHGVQARFEVSGYREDGYMLMRDVNNPFATMTIHPEHARRIRDCIDGDSGIKVLDCEALQNVHAKITHNAEPTTPSTPNQPGVTIPTASTATGTSKKVRAAAIKAANPTLSRKEIIALFIKELDMSHAGASTYFSYK